MQFVAPKRARPHGAESRATMRAIDGSGDSFEVVLPLVSALSSSAIPARISAQPAAVVAGALLVCVAGSAVGWPGDSTSLARIEGSQTATLNARTPNTSTSV